MGSYGTLPGRALLTDAPVMVEGIVYWQPPKKALEKVQQLVWDPSVSRYGADGGLPELREALMKKASVNIVLTLCDAEDSVIMFAPYYFNSYMSFQTTGVTNILIGPGIQRQSIQMQV